MVNRKDCCDKSYKCSNHDSWYCDECTENKNKISYFQSIYSDNICFHSDCLYNYNNNCSFKITEDNGLNCKDIYLPL